MQKLKQIKKQYDLLSVEAKAILWYTFCNVAQKGINMIVVPIYTRLLSPSEYGIFSVFNSWLQIFEIIATFHLFGGSYTVGLIKFEDRKKEYTSSLVKLSAGITTCFLVIYFIFQEQINAFTKMDTVMTLCLFVLLYTTPILGFWNVWERVENNYIQMIIVTLTSTIFIPLLAIVSLLTINQTAMSVIYSQVLVNVIIVVTLLILFRSIFFKKGNKHFWAYGLRTSVPLLPHHMSTIILNQSDRIMIQFLVGNTEAGIYSVAYSIALIMIIFNSSFNTSLQQWVFKCLKNNQTDSIGKVANSSTFLICALNLMIIFFAPEAMYIFAPKAYYSAIWIIPPVSISVVLMYIYQQFVNVEFYYEEGKMIALGSVGAAIMNIVLNALLIPKYGYLAAGYTTLISYAILTLFHYYFMKKICKKNEQKARIYDIKTLIFTFILFLIMASGALLTYEHMIIRYAILVLTGVVAFIKRDKIMDMWNSIKKK